MSVLLKYRAFFGGAVIGIFSLFIVSTVGATGPVFFDGDEAVSIYRDFDDGLFGRSLYRGVVFSVKLESFSRYRSLEVKDIDGLTGYLLSDETARTLAEGQVKGLSREVPGLLNYRYTANGIDIGFSLERAPDDLLEEIDRTYRNNPSVAEQVKDSYRAGWVIRINLSENLYRPGVARIEYEDVMICASLLGEAFQPLWGIHDGNALLSKD